MNVITRFPPSPTGYMHIGRARTALFNYLFARHNGGKMLFRLEDTDKNRSKKEYEENIVESLKWLGIVYDSEVLYQSGRNDIYKKYLKKLIDDGFAYISQERETDEPLKDGEERRKEVIRFKNPNKKIKFTDLIRGEIEFDTTDLKDFVIAKSLDEPLYHLAVVVDDHEMRITHVIRGEDGISNTPRQILIQEGIGAIRPVYAHIPLILAPDKSKLSGRRGAVGITDYRQKGYLSEAIINYIALLGWNPGTEQELFTVQELIESFTLENVQKSGAIFNEEKLKWFNKQYVAKMSETDFADHAGTFLPEWLSAGGDKFKKLATLLKDKIAIFGDILPLFAPDGELAFVKEMPEYPASLLLWKKNPDPKSAQEHLLIMKELLNTIPENVFTAETVKQAIWSYAEEKGRGDVLWPFRVALTGQEKSPDPFMCAYILGKDESLLRIEKACIMLKN